MITFEFYGKQYEFRGEYRVPGPNEFALSSNGTVLDFTSGWPDSDVIRAIVHPVLKRYTFGGVVFEETGEVRRASNQWVLYGDEPRWFNEMGSLEEHNFLRPVGLADAE